MAYQNVAMNLPSQGYLIYRNSAPDLGFDPTAPLAFYPPKDSDELFDALRLKYPTLKTHSERMRDAIIEFLLEQRAIDVSPLVVPEEAIDVSPWQQSWHSMPSTTTSSSVFSSPEIQDLATPNYTNSPHLSVRRPTSGSTSQPASIAAGTPQMEQMTGVFAVSASSQPRQRIRRKMTEAEKIEYRRRRIVKACEKCSKRKRKCHHNQPEMEHLAQQSARRTNSRPLTSHKGVKPSISSRTALPMPQPGPNDPSDFDMALMDMPLFDDNSIFANDPLFEQPMADIDPFLFEYINFNHTIDTKANISQQYATFTQEHANAIYPSAEFSNEESSQYSQLLSDNSADIFANTASWQSSTSSMSRSASGSSRASMNSWQSICDQYSGNSSVIVDNADAHANANLNANANDNIYASGLFDGIATTQSTSSDSFANININATGHGTNTTVQSSANSGQLCNTSVISATNAQHGITAGSQSQSLTAAQGASAGLIGSRSSSCGNAPVHPQDLSASRLKQSPRVQHIAAESTRGKIDAADQYLSKNHTATIASHSNTELAPSDKASKRATSQQAASAQPATPQQDLAATRRPLGVSNTIGIRSAHVENATDGSKASARSSTSLFEKTQVQDLSSELFRLRRRGLQHVETSHPRFSCQARSASVSSIAASTAGASAVSTGLFSRNKVAAQSAPTVLCATPSCSSTGISTSLAKQSSSMFHSDKSEFRLPEHNTYGAHHGRSAVLPVLAVLLCLCFPQTAFLAFLAFCAPFSSASSPQSGPRSDLNDRRRDIGPVKCSTKNSSWLEFSNLSLATSRARQLASLFDGPRPQVMI